MVVAEVAGEMVIENSDKRQKIIFIVPILSKIVFGF